jgi:uncharacterized SAM-binding protein YcdF (DUF218 family)
MYRIITLLLAPYTLLLLSLLGVLAWAYWKRRPRQRSIGIALALVVLLIVLSLPVTGYWVNGSLEWSYPPSDAVPAHDDTLVVLAGSAEFDDNLSTKVRLGTTTLSRCLHAYQVYERAGGCRVVVSGGSFDSSRPELTVAEGMRDFLVRLGAAPADVTLEATSTTTFENVVNTSRLLRERAGSRVFLVTSASHMRRAERCFQRQGISVIPSPCSHVARRLEFEVSSFVPTVEGLLGVQRALHEWLGLAWYRLHGRI